ncbi:hypothetical protein [Pantoea agglomerans]|uniref:hypothetical protein n=1 Tax=Enterobacter agglomerans TaxID=549 RepID=UPI0027850C33|nr:hypothetical protein [Pantoea agglomerans]MDQ0433508.1 hypothetical protein [Pantoea agglomerans]
MDNRYDDDYISDLTDRVFLIKNQLEAGKLRISENLVSGLRESFDKIRLTEDGKVDPSTVDGRIKAMGAAVSHFFERQEIKKNHSIIDFQEVYFKILFGNFSHFYSQMNEVSTEPYQFAKFVSNQDDFVKHLDEIFPDLLEDVKGFWEASYEIGEVHLQDGEQLKANFAGDLFPTYYENAVSCTGLYIDTMILPCPILRVGRLHGIADKKHFCFLLIKHVLTCMTYRDLALEDIQPAIVLVLPDRRDFHEDYNEALRERSTPFVLAHAQYLYGREFESREHLFEFSSSLTDIDKVFKEIKRPERLVFDTDWGPGGRAQLERHLSDAERLHSPVLDGNPGIEVMFTCTGRMPQALAARSNAKDFLSTPYINAKTSWLYYTWLMEYESLNCKVDENSLMQLHMVNALSKGMQGGFTWLGDVPMENILSIRRKGLMEEVRGILSSGVSELVAASSFDYNKSSQKVIDNVDKAFIQHKRFLEKAKKEKQRILGFEVAPFIINGTFGIASALINRPDLAAASFALGTFGIPTLKEINTSFKKRSEMLENYKKTATGLIFSKK